ncbi:hypothetical protein FDUTEX481_05412 [Tolypothrix sp. PCC 7601]|nr:hypothetical protein FDUTEX481_05412 [Tolypothrix sp. PCC 7601]
MERLSIVSGFWGDLKSEGGSMKYEMQLFHPLPLILHPLYVIPQFSSTD